MPCATAPSAATWCATFVEGCAGSNICYRPVSGLIFRECVRKSNIMARATQPRFFRT